jgi:thioredoxin-related protein
LHLGLLAPGANQADAAAVKKFLLPNLISLLAATVMAADPAWLTDYAAAKAKAKADNKLMLLDFTGSDWCGWCKRLNVEVFSQPQFQEYAAKNLVLVELDFPRWKEQSDTVKKQNRQLAAEYQIEGFPTLIVLNREGKKVGILGYMEGGPAVFIAALEKIRKS